ncbi:hypothetical protein ISCGN_010433 [Ixodes scapularis]
MAADDVEACRRVPTRVGDKSSVIVQFRSRQKRDSEQIRTQQELIQRQQQQIQQQQHQLDGPVQHDPANANTTPPVPTGTAADGGTPAAVISNAASLGACRAAVKLPPFSADSPEVWFAQVKAKFSLARITEDRTRYDYVVAHLDSRYANEIRDIFDNPPAANLYQHLKTELTRRLSLSEDQKVRQPIQPRNSPSANHHSSSATCVLSQATCKSTIFFCGHYGSQDYHRTSRPFCMLTLRYL